MLKIALTNLGQYNEGMLNYKWIDLPIDEDDLEKAMSDIDIGKEDSFGCPYEEYFISDYETDISGLKVGEYSNIDVLNEYAEQTNDLQDDECLALQAFLEDGNDFDYALEQVKEGNFVVWRGCSDIEDVALQCIDEGYLGEIPERIRNYIDYKAYARDLNISGKYYAEIDDFGNTHMVELID